MTIYKIHLVSGDNLYSSDADNTISLLKSKPLSAEIGYCVLSTYCYNSQGQYVEQNGHVLVKPSAVEYIRVFTVDDKKVFELAQ